MVALYLLAQGPENRIDPVGEADAGRELLGNILFFAEDPEFVHRAFQAACDFVHRVPRSRLTFVRMRASGVELGKGTYGDE